MNNMSVSEKLALAMVMVFVQTAMVRKSRAANDLVSGGSFSYPKTIHDLFARYKLSNARAKLLRFESPLCNVSFPTSFAILVYFGTDGQSQSLYSSELHNERCKPNKIWDPFNNQCRQVYCSKRDEEYQYKSQQCVKDTDDDDQRPYIKFLDSQSQFVNVTIGFRTNKTFTERFIRDNGANLLLEYRRQFCARWALNTNHLANATVRYVDKQSLSINFCIVEKPQNHGAMEKISKKILIEESERYELLNMVMIAVSIHTDISELEGFCSNETDMPIWYWNTEFAFITDKNATHLYVNGTGRIYDPGQYTASVLYVEKVQNGPGDPAEFSTNAVVCEKSLIDNDCPRILFNRNEYEFVDGRHLVANGIQFEQYELVENQSILVCLPPISEPAPPEMSLDLKIESILSTVLMLISILLLSLLLVTFCRLATIRKSITGFTTINLAACLATMQILFLSSDLIQNCRITAVGFHFAILTTITWSSVIAFDLHKTLIKSKLVSRKNSTKLRLTYAAAAYLPPLMIILIANLGDLFNIGPIRADYGPLFHTKTCWMQQRQAVVIYFVLPVVLTTVYNMILYVKIVCNIRNDIKSFSSLRKVSRIPSACSQISSISMISSDFHASHETIELTGRSFFNQTSIYLRLGLPLGFTWILALICILLPQNIVLLTRIMSYIFLLANTSQGIVLFFAFSIHKKLFVCTALNKRYQKQPNRSF